MGPVVRSVGQAVRHPDAARDRAELDERRRTMVAEIVRHGQCTGDFCGVDADRFAQTLTALLDGLAVQVAVGDETVTSALALDLATELCRRMLQA